MDKYAVVVDESHAKTAAAKGSCPSCGSGRVNTTGLTPHCPNCGTRPWEKNASKEKTRRRW